MSKDYEASDIVHKFVQYLVRTSTTKHNRASSYHPSDSSGSIEEGSRTYFKGDNDISLKSSMFTDSENLSISDKGISQSMHSKDADKNNNILKNVKENLFIKIIIA